MSFAREGLAIGGGNGIINATQHDHGPSWKMIVEMTTPTVAYGIYPGGQSGNPGSRFYDDLIDKWTKGQYNKLFIMDLADVKAKSFKWKMTFKPV
jgi:penicillin amidase